LGQGTDAGIVTFGWGFEKQKLVEKQKIEKGIKYV
jgi:hypothetical protein